MARPHKRPIPSWCDPAWAALVEQQIPGVVARNQRMFTHFPEIDRDDLLSEARIAACRAHRTYDPALSAPATYVRRAAKARLIDLYRQCRRKHRKDRMYADARGATLEKFDVSELQSRYCIFAGE